MSLCAPLVELTNLQSRSRFTEEVAAPARPNAAAAEARVRRVDSEAAVRGRAPFSRGAWGSR